MTVAGLIKIGAYFDSVTLMRVGKELAGQPVSHGYRAARARRK
jgi:hypothetical protein